MAMKIYFFLLLIELPLIVHSAKYDEGNKYVSCGSNALLTGTITFNTVFKNTPKVAAFTFNLDVPTYSKFSFETGNITTTKFDYKIKTLTNHINQYAFYWRAFDDTRIEIINRFDQDVSGGSNKIYTISHSNPCALYGFVAPTNFGINGAIYFDLSITSITKNEVVVSLVQNTTNLLTLGFTIVLGTDQSFFKDTSVTVYNIQKTDPLYVYSYVDQKIGYSFSIILNSLNNPLQGTGTRLDLTSQVNNNNTISYQIRTWWYTVLTSLKYQFIWFNNLVFQPLLYKKMRVSKYFRMNLDQSYVKIQFLELNKSFNTITSQNIPISSSILNVTVIVQVHCYSGLKIQGSILQCISCELKGYTWNQQCYNGINSVYYYIKLYQLDLIEQQIQLNLQSQKITINNDINNVLSPNYKVLEIQLMNV